MHLLSQASLLLKLFSFPSQPPYSKMWHSPSASLKYHFSKEPRQVPTSGLILHTSKRENKWTDLEECKVLFSLSENQLTNLEKSVTLISFELAAPFQTCLNWTLSINQIQIQQMTILFKHNLQLNCQLLDLNLCHRSRLIKACQKRSGKFKTQQRC